LSVAENTPDSNTLVNQISRSASSMLGCKIVQPNILTGRCRSLRLEAINRAVSPLSFPGSTLGR